MRLSSGLEYYKQVMMLKLISRELPKFHDEGGDLWRCRCIICGDSRKSNTKARGYFYKSGDLLNYKCHNCGSGMSIIRFCKKFFPNVFNEFLADEVMGNGQRNRIITFEQELAKVKRQSAAERLKLLGTCETKHETKEHWLAASLKTVDQTITFNQARKYLEKRNLGFVLNRFFYIPSVQKLTEKLEHYDSSDFPDSEAVGIPHWSVDKSRLEYLQCRMLTESKKLRYITLVVDARPDTHKFFGLENIQHKSKTKYTYLSVTEGAFDSCFIDNCVAISGISDWQNISSLERFGYRIRFVPDNDVWYNKQVYRTVKSIVSAGYHVVLLPKQLEIKQKDTNDLSLSGMSNEEINKLYERYTYGGFMAAKLLDDNRF